MTEQKGHLELVPPSTDELLAEYHAMRKRMLFDPMDGHTMTIIQMKPEMEAIVAYCYKTAH